MQIHCPYCHMGLTVDERIVQKTGGGPCPSCGHFIAITMPMTPSPVASPEPAASVSNPQRNDSSRRNGIMLAIGLSVGVMLVLGVCVTFVSGML